MTEHRAEEDGVSTLNADRQRFAARVNLTPTCHYWTGATDRDGYGSFNADGKKYRAHVYAYVQAHGDVPPDMELDHLCHRRNCVNPAHLEPVSHADNLAQRSDRQPSTSLQPVIDAESGTVTSLVTGTVSELREPITGRFVKGHAPLAGGGRPKKGESLLAYTRKLVEKASNKQAVAEAKLDRLLDRGSVGNRAWAEYRDTFEGVPKQTLVLEQADSPLASLLERLASRQAPIYIEGEARVVDITPAVDAHSET